MTAEVESEEFTGYSGYSEQRDVAVLKINDIEVWRDPEGQYFDTYGDGGTQIADVIADLFRRVLNEPARVQ